MTAGPIYKIAARVPITQALLDDFDEYGWARLWNHRATYLPKHRLTLAIAACAVLLRLARR